MSGGFLPIDYINGPHDLDHDQRLNLAVGINWQPQNYFVNLQVNYGSGLTNGNDDNNFKTGLLDLNQGAHTLPAWIINFSAGYEFNAGNNNIIEPSVYITNLLDHAHLIKGTYFSGAYFEERRNVVFKISYKM